MTYVMTDRDKDIIRQLDKLIDISEELKESIRINGADGDENVDLWQIFMERAEAASIS